MARTQDMDRVEPRVWVSRLLGREARPDRSREGFEAAVDLGLERAREYDWLSIDHMIEELATVIGDALRSGSVSVEFVARRRKDGWARIVIRTDWGHRAAVDVGVRLTPGRPVN